MTYRLLKKDLDQTLRGWANQAEVFAPQKREGYAQFRADHVDGFKIRDLGNGALLTIAIVGAIAGLVYLAM